MCIHGCTCPYGSEPDLCRHGTLWRMYVHSQSTAICMCMHGTRVCTCGAPWTTYVHAWCPLARVCTPTSAPGLLPEAVSARGASPLARSTSHPSTHSQGPLLHPTPSTPQLCAPPGRSRRPSSALLQPQHAAAAPELVQEHPRWCGSTRCVALATIWEQGLAARLAASGAV